MSNKPSFKSNKSKEIICYCFSYTKEDIEKDLKLNGKSTILEYIKKSKLLGKCNCISKSPLKK